MTHSSPIPNSEDITQSYPTAVDPSAMTSLPQRPRKSSEDPAYRQQSTRDLGKHQEAAGRLSAVAGGTASHGIFLQPDPVAVDEVRIIYAGLIMVEKKCIEVHKAESEPCAPFDNEKWQGLVSLHQTLLQEHHEFFIACQRLTTSSVLRRLPDKYAMPGRLWRYGIYSFLELLRHRLPESREHMLSYVNIARSILCLLLDTV